VAPADAAAVECGRCGKTLRLRTKSPAVPPVRPLPPVARAAERPATDDGGSAEPAPSARTPKRTKRKTREADARGRRLLIGLAAAQALWHVLCCWTVWSGAARPENFRYEGDADKYAVAKVWLIGYAATTAACLALLFWRQGWARFPLGIMAVMGFFQGVLVAGRGVLRIGGGEGLEWLLEGAVRSAFNGSMAFAFLQSETLRRWLQPRSVR
jgi:hypothetical protein